MPEKPIPFSGEMVLAILDGRKSQTRRVMKPQPPPCSGIRCLGGADWLIEGVDDDIAPNDELPCPYGQPGDRLWVRETWADWQDDEADEKHGVIYRATYVEPATYKAKWRSSIFMPRWASRITLELTAVRVQRVQEISEEDAVAEGVGALGQAIIKSEEFGRSIPGAIYQFAHLWDASNLKRGFGWEKNPWVWALTFRRIDNA